MVAVIFYSHEMRGSRVQMPACHRAVESLQKEIEMAEPRGRRPRATKRSEVVEQPGRRVAEQEVSLAARIDDVPEIQAEARRVVSDDVVRRRAYELYLMRGAQQGNELDDWFRAEREVLQREPDGRAPR